MVALRAVIVRSDSFGAAPAARPGRLLNLFKPLRSSDLLVKFFICVTQENERNFSAQR